MQDQAALLAPAQAPAAPPPPDIPLAPDVPSVFVTVPGAEPTQLYEAFRAQREELRDQLRALEEQRDELAEQLRDPMTQGADRGGLEARVVVVDGRIAQVDQQLAGANADLARTAAIPGAVPVEIDFDEPDGPDTGFILAVLFLLVCVLPLSLAWARRIWRRGGPATASLPPEVHQRFDRLEQSVEAVALEVERVGEGQRFMTRVLSEQPERAARLAEPERVAAGS